MFPQFCLCWPLFDPPQMFWPNQNLKFSGSYHYLVEHIAGLEIPMDNPQPRVLMKIKKPSSNSANNIDPNAPI